MEPQVSDIVWNSRDRRAIIISVIEKSDGRNCLLSIDSDKHYEFTDLYGYELLLLHRSSNSELHEYSYTNTLQLETDIKAGVLEEHITTLMNHESPNHRPNIHSLANSI